MIQKSTSLEYDPSSEPPHISAQQWSLNECAFSGDSTFGVFCGLIPLQAHKVYIIKPVLAQKLLVTSHFQALKSG